MILSFPRQEGSQGLRTHLRTVTLWRDLWRDSGDNMKERPKNTREHDEQSDSNKERWSNVRCPLLYEPAVDNFSLMAHAQTGTELLMSQSRIRSGF